MTSSIRAERSRAGRENDRLESEIKRESEEVERRLRERYGQASLRRADTFVCLPRAFVPAAPPRLQ